MVNDVEGVFGRQTFQPNFVIGLTLRQNSKAYYYSDIAELGTVNDTLGEFPVLIWASDEIYQAFIRLVDGQTLTFRFNGENLIDEETGSQWDPNLGLARSGPLVGKSLQPVPSLSSFDWAWVDFYPDSEFYKP